MKNDILTDSDIKRIMTFIDENKDTRFTLRNRAMVNLSLRAGMRNSHIADLLISEVLTSDGQIKDLVSKGKQVVYLNSQVKTDIANYLEHRFSRSLEDICHLNQVMSAHIFSLHVFANQRRGHFNEDTLPPYLRNIYRRANVTHATASSARHTFIKKIVTTPRLSITQMSRLTGIDPSDIAVLNKEDDSVLRDVIEQM